MHVYSRDSAAAAKSRQLCPTLCNPMDGCPGILQARILEWAAISFSLETVSVALKETLVTHIHNIKHLNNCIYF